MINPRMELVKRVTNTLHELRGELIAAGVDEKSLADTVTVEETEDGVAVHFFFDYTPVKTVKISEISATGDTEEERQKAADSLHDALNKHKRNRG